MSTPGSFVWHELMTKDPEAALKFYGELFGWKYKTGEMGPMKYHEILVGERPIGGITGTMGPGQPSAWHAYVSVDNVDAAMQRATQHGGKVQMPPMDIPGTGRFAMLADPSGAVIAPFTYTSEQPSKPEVQGQPGTFVWNELLTEDPQAGQRFYSQVFGWSVRGQDMGPMGTYHLFQRGGQDVAGMMKKPAEVPVSFWLYYVGVADVDAVHNKALALGAQPTTGPMDVPGVGRLSGFIDPAGAMLSLFKGAAQ
jgi:predicted enzyme related to lactoylglutathione lyase